MQKNVHAFSNTIALLKAKNPIILSLTNHVVMTQTANALLTIGASPIMSLSIEEIKALITISHSLNINIGTLDKNHIERMKLACQIANEKKVPVAFDPVGVGASSLRTKTAYLLLEKYEIAILKANAAEILALDEKNSGTNTIDSQQKSDKAIKSAKKLSQQFNCTVVVSGEVDYCITKNSTTPIPGGSALMPKVTGTGCIATAICAAFLSVSESNNHAAIMAMQLMAKAGEKATGTCHGPGSFMPSFLDALYHLCH